MCEGVCVYVVVCGGCMCGWVGVKVCVSMWLCGGVCMCVRACVCGCEIRKGQDADHMPN